MRTDSCARHEASVRRRFRRFVVEQLEDRRLLAGNTIDITLDRWLDQFGYQPEVSQAYEDMVSLGSIFDTGASIVSFSATDQFLLDPFGGGGNGIPVKVSGGAQAEGIGGILTGDVSQPGTVLVDGIHVNVWSGDIFSDAGGLYFDQIQGRGFVEDAAPSGIQFAGDPRLNMEPGIYNGYSLLFTSTASASAGNLGVSRTITGYDGSTRTFSLASAFPNAPVSGDTFHILVGQGATAGPLAARQRLSANPAGLGLSGIDGDYVGRYLLFTSGALAGEAQLISAYEGATHTFDVALSFSQRPQPGDTFDILVGTGSSAVMPGVQMFLGTMDGSPLLSTLAGTPMLNPTLPLPAGSTVPNPVAGPQPVHPAGLALKVGPQNLLLDLGAVLGDLFPDGLFDGITMPIPSVEFREPGTKLARLESFHAESSVDASSVVSTPLQFAGGSELPDAPEFADFYAGFELRFLTGSLAGQLREVSAYDETTRTFTFITPFSQAPAPNDLFELVRTSTDPVTLGMEFIEFDNHLDPGDIITVSYNPVASEVRLAQSLASGSVASLTAPDQLVADSADNSLSVSDDAYNGFTLVVTSGPLTGERVVIADYTGSTRTFQLQSSLSGTPAPGTTFDVFDESTALDQQVFLFDTGAQLSVISTAEATALGLDLLAPEFTTSVQGAGGVVADLPGYVLDELRIPTLEGGFLVFRDAPVYVLDVAPMLDGILGMNLFNNAAEFLYDAFDPVNGRPTLQVTFFEERAEVVTEIDVAGLGAVEAALLQSVAEVMPVAFGQAVGLHAIGMPSFGVGVDVDLTPQVGVAWEENGVPVVAVAPGAAVPFTAHVSYTAEAFDAFQLDFSASNPALHLRDWISHTVWTTTTDGTLAFPGDPAVSAQGNAQLSSTLGTFVVDVPAVPGDYLLTVDDAQDHTSFSLTSMTDPLSIRDFGGIVIRVQETPTLTIGDATLIEGADGALTNLEFTVLLTGVPSGPVSVDYATADGSASAAGGDYLATTGTLQFAVGQTQKTIAVPIRGDANPETDEDFFVNLSNARIETGPLVLTPVSDATGVNVDGDFEFDYLETDAELELRTGTNPSSRAFALEFDLSEVPAGATLTSATLSFVETTDTVDPGFLPASVYGYAGDNDGVVTLDNPFNVLLSDEVGSVGNRSVGTQSIEVTSFVQSLLAGGGGYAGFYVESWWDEYYIHSSEAVSPANRPKLTIEWSVGPATVQISDAQAVGLIRNDDTEISISDRQQSEGDAGDTHGPFVIQLSHPTALDVTVAYATADGTARGGDDYLALAGRVAFAPGETVKAISVPIRGDGLVEPNETFFVALSAASNAVLSAGYETGTGTIANDDLAVVTEFLPVGSGFQVRFNGDPDAGVLNLYDQDGTFGPADVTLVGANTGPVRGSLVPGPGGQAFTFVKTDGLLPPDTYTVTLRSAADGWKDVNGQSLDGNGNETPGDNYVTSFLVEPPAAGAIVVSLPNVTRGRGQPVNVPADNLAAGLPLTISNGWGVSRVDLQLHYDPALLEISAFTVNGALAGGDAQATLTFPEDGIAALSITAPVSLAAAAGSLIVGSFTARVPDSAPYRAKHILDIEELHIYDTETPPLELASIDDDAIHVAAFLGDTDGDGTYNSPDASLVRRIIGQVNTGFAASPMVDPVLIADITQNNVIQSNDTTGVRRAIVQIAVPHIPPLPTGLDPPAPSGADPRLFIPRDLTGAPGETVSVPVMIEVTEPAGLTLGGFDLMLEYDANRFIVSQTQVGDLLQGTDLVGTMTQPASGKLIFSADSLRGTSLFPAGTVGTLVTLTVAIAADAAPGPVRWNLLASLGPSRTGVYDASLQELVLNPRPTNDARDLGDGVLLVDDGLPPWHNGANPYDVNWDGLVTPLDALVLINYLNVVANEGGPAAESMLRALYGDVNDDSFCTAEDVLAVINHLNAAPFPAAEGESNAFIPMPVAASRARPTDHLQDQIFGDLAADWSSLEGSLSDLAEEVASAWR
jgi:hypothetical protein